MRIDEMVTTTCPECGAEFALAPDCFTHIGEAHLDGLQPDMAIARGISLIPIKAMDVDGVTDMVGLYAIVEFTEPRPLTPGDSSYGLIQLAMTGDVAHQLSVLLARGAAAVQHPRGGTDATP